MNGLNKQSVQKTTRIVIFIFKTHLQMGHRRIGNQSLVEMHGNMMRKTDAYYLHLFDVTQADLNWGNEKVRQALYDIVNYWIKFGVDGFRFDVINLISKGEFKDSSKIGKILYGWTTCSSVFT